MYHATSLRSEFRAGYSWCIIKRSISIFCIFIRHFSASFCSCNSNYFHFFPAFVRWILQRKTERSWEWSPPHRREIILYMRDQCRSFSPGELERVWGTQNERVWLVCVFMHVYYLSSVEIQL